MVIRQWVFPIAIFLVAGAAADAQTPSVDPGRIYNSASFAVGQPVAPGSLVSIFGSNFTSGNVIANMVPLPTSLGDVSITFNDMAAPLFGVFHGDSSDQINAQVPWSVLAVLPPGSTGTAQVIVTRNNVTSAPQTVVVTNAAPGIFTLSATGAGQAIAYGNTDGQLAAPQGSIAGLTTHPAKINDPLTLAILATGLGPVSSQPANGDIPANGTISYTQAMPVVLVGGIPAVVVFSGLSPQFVGVYQINIIIQPGTPTGDAVPLQIQMNGITTTDKVTIAVSN